MITGGNLNHAAVLIGGQIREKTVKKLVVPSDVRPQAQSQGTGGFLRVEFHPVVFPGGHMDLIVRRGSDFHRRAFKVQFQGRDPVSGVGVAAFLIIRRGADLPEIKTAKGESDGGN